MKEPRALSRKRGQEHFLTTTENSRNVEPRAVQARDFRLHLSKFLSTGSAEP